MDTSVKFFLLITSVCYCNGVSLRRQLQHIAESQKESQSFPEELPSRRHFYKYDPREVSEILGAPSLPSHLPEAEPILPGHTLIKPALGMLKSAVKFPHRDLEDGSGVYGNYENIGLRYDSKNERVLYSGFRRMPDGVRDPDPELRSNNKITLYPNDNKEPLTKKRNNGPIYLKRIYASKLPTAFKTFGNNVKRKRKTKRNYQPMILHSDIETGFENLHLRDDRYNEADYADSGAVGSQNSTQLDRFWNSENTFNHIAIDQNAPDYADLFPTVNHENARQWWFFNEGDLQRPLQIK